MSLLIESIKLVDGKFHNLFYHEQRMLRSLDMLCGNREAFQLEKFLLEQAYPKQGLYKCRIVYDGNSKETMFVPYQAKTIKQLKIIEHDGISYEFKFADRKTINRLFELRGKCDDILIIRRGMVTDCSFSNIAFRKGKTWCTPWPALLKGTMRQNLIDKNYIQQEEIHKKDIRSFDTFKIINAMLEFDSPETEVSNIVF
jgi:4-amino-4-deoxychorismate lyase